jgi:outer membrane lipoprotein-sorting protein
LKRRAWLQASFGGLVGGLVGESQVRVVHAKDAKDKGSEAVKAILAELTKSRSKLKTMTCSFKQERVLGLLATKVESKGRMWMKRPSHLRWELLPPDQAIYWVTPQGIAYKTPEGSGKVKPSNAGTMAVILDDIMVLMGGDLQLLLKRYQVQATKDNAGTIRLELVPTRKSLKKVLSKVVVEIAKDKLSPQRLELIEPKGDKAEIQFENVKINPKIPADIWKVST